MSVILNKNTNCLLKDRPWEERLISQVINTHAFMSHLCYEMATFQKRYCFFMTDFCEPALDDFNGLNYIHHSPSFHVHTKMPDWHLFHRGKREARRLGLATRTPTSLSQPAMCFLGPSYFCHVRMRRSISSFDTTRPARESSRPRATMRSNASSRMISS